MIIGNNFVWGHIPKTGGTSAEKIFDIIGENTKIIHIDRRKNVLKHDNFDIKQKRLKINLDQKRKRILNIRRLPIWVLSFANHKSWKIPFTRQDVLNGRVNSLYPLDNMKVKTLEEAWRSTKVYNPDEFLEHFMCGRVDHWIRTEYLAQDTINVMANYTKLSKNQKDRIKKVYLNKRSYNKNIKDWFQTKKEMKQIYDKNPLWSKVELEIYGNLLYEEIF